MPELLSVFGGTGFVGSEFCRQFGRPLQLIPRSSRQPVSRDSVYFISTTHNHHVFHDVHHDVQTNLTILLETLRNVKEGDTFNFISSWFVYGRADLPARENACCHPLGFYSITKRTAEQLLISYCQTFGINFRILRLCNVYGPADADVSASKNALQFLINRLKRNEPVSLYDGGEFTRDYLHVADVARAIDLCIERGPLNQTINIGSGKPERFSDLIEMARQLLRSRSDILPMEPTPFQRHLHVQHFHMDVAQLRHLGFVPRISMAEGIKQLCQ